MASTIKIKRSEVSGNPAVLGAGELAYSALADNGSNGGDRLYIGSGTETSGNAVNHIVVGGKYYTGLIDATTTAGTLATSAKSIPILSATGTIDQWLVGSLKLSGSTLISTTTNTDVNITPNGTGNTSITNLKGLNGTLANITSFGIRDTSAAFDVLIAATSSTTLTAARTLTLDMVNAARSIKLGGNLSFAGDLTTSGAFATTLTTTAATTLTLPTTGTLATLAGSETFTNKTLTSPTINGGTHTAITNLAIRDTSAAFDVTIAATSSTLLTAARTLTLDMVNAARSIKLSGNLSFAGDLTTSGAFATTLTTTAATTLTLPTTGTLATLAGSETFTNKTHSTGSTWNGNTIGVAYGGTGTATGSITGTGALTFTAGGTNTNVNLVPNGTGTVDVSSKRITNLADPTGSQDAATKAYVDAVKTGLDIKDSVRVATTANLVAIYTGASKILTNNTTLAPIAIDGITLAVNDRVLVKDQSVASSNGIYTVTTVGTGAVAWVLTRAGDFDNTPGTEITGGAFAFVEEGTTNADSGWVLTTDGTVTLDTTNLTFVQFSGAGQISAGNGLTKTGNTIDVVGTANRISVAADSVDIASTYVGQTSITTLGTIGTGVWQGTIVGPTYGGTGVNNGSSTITLGGSLTTSGAFATTLTVTAATTVTLPTTGTLATLAGSETFTNKTISTSSTWNGNTIGSGYGGTGFNTYAAGDIIYASAANTLSKLAKGSDGQLLQLVSGLPVWAAIDGGTY